MAITVKKKTLTLKTPAAGQPPGAPPTPPSGAEGAPPAPDAGAPVASPVAAPAPVAAAPMVQAPVKKGSSPIPGAIVAILAFGCVVALLLIQYFEWDYYHNPERRPCFVPKEYYMTGIGTRSAPSVPVEAPAEVKPANTNVAVEAAAPKAS